MCLSAYIRISIKLFMLLPREQSQQTCVVQIFTLKVSFILGEREVGVESTQLICSIAPSLSLHL